MKIKYGKRQTKNLGNYENLTFEVSVEDDVCPAETQEECFLRLKEFVDTKLDEQFSDKKPEEKTLDIETVKNKLVSLINKNENNRGIIKNILKSYNANRIQDLDTFQLEKFNNEIIKL